MKPVLKKVLYTISFLFIISSNNIYASEYESRVVSKINDFAEKLISSYNLNPGASIAIMDFDNIGESSKKYNIGFTVSEVITQSFQQKNRYIIIERKQLNKILETLSLEQTGLYDSDKIASLGKLIGAQYIVVGSVSDFAGFYRISVRIVKVETGEIVLIDALEIDKDLMEEASEKYLPANYRLSLSGVYKYRFNEEKSEYEGGFGIGFSYDIKMNHSILFNFRYLFDQRRGSQNFPASNLPLSYKEVFTKYYLDHSIELMLGYGYIIPVTRNLSLRPKINFGFSRLMYRIDINEEREVEFDSERTVLSDETYIYETGFKNQDFLFIQPGIDLLLMYNNPVSVIFSFNYNKYLSKFKFTQKYQNFPEYVSEKDFSSLEMRMGVQVYI